MKFCMILYVVLIFNNLYTSLFENFRRTFENSVQANETFENFQLTRAMQRCAGMMAWRVLHPE